MDTVGPRRPRRVRPAVDQKPGARGVATPDRLPQQCRVRRGPPPLHQGQPGREGAIEAHQQRVTTLVGRRDGVALGQGQRPNDRRVGGGERIGTQPGGGDPAPLGHLDGPRRLARRRLREPHVELDPPAGVVEGDTNQRAARCDGDPELLADLADQRVGDGLAGLHLATGELPQPALVQMIRSPRDQHAAVPAADHRDGHMDRLHGRAHER
ncbi:hypothetical protein KBTX_04387 [wastewater metagenome]|uniref:Uncharacterized protein n=2 Tax=unclassified sequences TaxID=12908 RepID=A0A5B8RG26_9ZZZZ|nr:hypothetical protein KBTEX_04387 [uncultured organism]